MLPHYDLGVIRLGFIQIRKGLFALSTLVLLGFMGQTAIAAFPAGDLEMRQISTSGGSQPSWSPDGEKIAYFRSQPGSQASAGIWVMNSDGSGKHEVVEPIPFPGGVDWSPDGSQLAFHRSPTTNPNGTDIYTVPVSGGLATRITNASDAPESTNYYYQDPSWSPNGKRIAFSSSRDAAPGEESANNSLELYTMKPDGSNVVRVTNDGDGERRPDFSPDGTSLVFNGFGQYLEIHTIAIDGTDEKILPLSGSLNAAAWSPNGDEIAFSASLGLAGGGIFVTSIDGSNPRNVTPNSLGFANDPSYSPDGQQVAFEVNDNIWVAGATGSIAVDRRRVGISINGGRCCTNDPEVSIGGKGPDGFATLVLSNDGGFAEFDSFPLLQPTVPWTLQGTGPERLPKTIYAQFEDPYTQQISTTYSDDIILDQTSPLLTQLASSPIASSSSRNRIRISPRGEAPGRYRVKIKARDNASGVKKMKVATSKRQRKRVKWRAFRRKLVIATESRWLHVQVQDGAGNASKWRQSKLRR